jgi:predicted RNA polymerase sigma factor
VRCPISKDRRVIFVFDSPVQPPPLCSRSRIGRFQLEAAVQSVQAARRTTGRTDWHAILELYDGLLALTGSPVVAVHRTVALGETAWPAAGLAALDELARDPRLVAYQPYWAARATCWSASVGMEARTQPMCRRS